ncbi:hypothetical protein FDP41_007751 [Naegleria fowleri]|uniref:Uncharacterized protein n=1 Tax=Naegleria fowleri TaxID=5763 RepID=A0A6A5C7T9_NAEFO|nr:uncharacterized protein FDP41_007751 [Naegleria fowleri]KAF0983836.1 hypothetical protein FDP41_007751 [Naegleria fowleri]CAG4714664.1 unnamed protein product [Naegleria fowleri]
MSSSSHSSKFTIVDLTKEVEETTKEQVSTNGRAKRNKINKRFRNNPGFASNFFFFPSNVNSTTGQSSHNLQSQQQQQGSSSSMLCANTPAIPCTQTAAASINKHESEKNTSRKVMSNTSPNSYPANSSTTPLNPFTFVTSDNTIQFDEKGNAIAGTIQLPSCEIQSNHTFLDEASMLDLLQNEDTCVEMSPSFNQSCLSTNNTLLANFLSSPQNFGFSNIASSNNVSATPNSSTTPPSSQKRHGRNPTAKRGSICQEIIVDKRRYSCSDVMFSQTKTSHQPSSFTNISMVSTINAQHNSETPKPTRGRLASPQATWETLQSFVFPTTTTYEVSEESSNERILCEESQYSTTSYGFQEENSCEAYTMNPSLKKRRPSVQVDTDSLSSFVANFQNQMNLSNANNSSLGFNNVVLVNPSPKLQQQPNQVYEPSLTTKLMQQHQTMAANTTISTETTASTIFNSLPQTVQQQVVDIIVNHLLVQSSQERAEHVPQQENGDELIVSGHNNNSSANASSFLDEKDLQTLDLPGFDIATSEPSSDTPLSPSLLSPSTFSIATAVESSVNNNNNMGYSSGVIELAPQHSVLSTSSVLLTSSSISSESLGDLRNSSSIQSSPTISNSRRDMSSRDDYIPSSLPSEISAETLTVSESASILYQGVSSASNPEEVNFTEEEYESILRDLFQQVPQL